MFEVISASWKSWKSSEIVEIVRITACRAQPSCVHYSPPPRLREASSFARTSCPICCQCARSVLGSWGKTMRVAARNTERWKRRRAPTQYPSTDLGVSCLGQRHVHHTHLFVRAHFRDRARIPVPRCEAAQGIHPHAVSSVDAAPRG